MARTVQMLGWVADLCPICHVVDLFKIYRHGNAASIQRIPLGPGRLHRCEAICGTCGWTHVVDAGSFREILYEPVGSIHGVLAATNPDLPKRAARELNLARALADGSLTPEQRRELVEGVFRAAAEFASTEGTSQATSLGADVKARLVLLPLLLAGLVALMSAVFGFDFEIGWKIWLGALALLLASMVYAWWRESDRFARRFLHPLLVRGLAPLEPTADEIREAARRHKRFLKTYGRVLDGLAEAVAAP